MSPARPVKTVIAWATCPARRRTHGCGRRRNSFGAHMLRGKVLPPVLFILTFLALRLIQYISQFTHRPSLNYYYSGGNKLLPDSGRGFRGESTRACRGEAVLLPVSTTDQLSWTAPAIVASTCAARRSGGCIQSLSQLAISRSTRPCGTSLLSPAKGPVNGRATFRPLGSHKRRTASLACAKQGSILRASTPDGSSPETPGSIRDGSSQNKRTHFRLYDFVGWGGGGGGDVVDAQGCVTECSVVV
jgi:hypothetical protein